MPEEKNVWAPRTNTNKIGSKGSTDGNSVSFEAYFLRDLYTRGKIDDKLIREIVEVEKLGANADEIIDVIANPTGDSVARGLVEAIKNLAQIVSERN